MHPKRPLPARAVIVAGLVVVTETSFTLEIARAPECARLAREAILEALPESESRDSLEAIASELVTNAYVHGTGPITMTVALNGNEMHIDVTNHIRDSGIKLIAGIVSSDSDHGRGLALVELLAQSWEYSVKDSGITELTVSASITA
jgi:anti-sigma regulatory factor (Ser/Thr protein kinase)